MSKEIDKDTRQTHSEEEDIQVLAPPPKIPPLCIDLTSDDKPTSPSTNLSLDAKSTVHVEQNQQSLPVISQNVSLQTSPLEESSTFSTTTVPSISVTASAGKKSVLDDEGRSALNLRLVDLQSEDQQGKDRIAVIDRTIEELLLERKTLIDRLDRTVQELELERKALTDKMYLSKQQQFDLLQSAMSINCFGSETAPRQDSTNTSIETPAVTESALAKRKRVSSYEPVKPQAKAVKLKVTNPKTVKPKVVEPKKSSTSVNARQITQMPTKVNSPYLLEDFQTNSHESNAASETISTNPIPLQSHLTAVRCVHICGSYAFTGSENGMVHVYNLKNNSVSMRIVVHKHPVTWLFGITMNISDDMLKTLNCTDYLRKVTLITGCNSHIRQFALESGSCTHAKFCNAALTCAVGNKSLRKLFVGTTDGRIFSYDLDKKILLTMKFQGDSEIICLKYIFIREKKCLIVAAKKKDPVVFDLQTGESLLTLLSHVPGSSFFSITSSPTFVFFFDSNKSVFKLGLNSDHMDHTETLPSVAVSSCFYDFRYLILGCMDGTIRFLDTTNEPPHPLRTLPGQGFTGALSCMKVLDDTIVVGFDSGEVLYYRLPLLKALFKATP